MIIVSQIHSATEYHHNTYNIVTPVRFFSGHIQANDKYQ